MFNLFRKKQHKQQQKPKEPQGKPFDISDTKADLQAYYDLSVQRKAQDFIITTVATDSGDEISVAMDSLDGYNAKGLQNAYEANFVGQEIIFTHFAAKSFIGFNNCAILAQDWLINKALCLPCEDAIAINYDITLKNADDTDKDIISEMKCLSEDKENIYDIKSVCERFATNKRKFGQALCFPLVDGVDYSVPFNLDGIDRGTYRGMCVIEPYWVAPVLDMKSTTDPMSKRFYKPTWFRMPDGRLIHYTWFIFNTYTEVADILKPTYYFGGVPLTQMLYEQVYAAQKTANEAPMLAQSKRLNYMEGNLNAFLNDEERLNKEITLMTWLRNNFGWLFIKKDQRIGQLDTSLTDFDAVTMLGFQLVAAISGVQAARLLETSPKGWQSSGSLEDKNYSKLQQSIQRMDYVPILNMHYKLMAKSRHGLDRDYECVFDPIDTPTEKERAEIKEINSRTDMNYIQAGVISPDEARTVLREDINSGYNTLSEEMEGEGADPFGDLMGGGENSQSPFSMDEEPDDWITTENGVHIPLDNGEGKKEACEEFFESKVEKSSKRGKIDSNKYKPVQISKEEYGIVFHAMKTNFPKMKNGRITKDIGNHTYTMQYKNGDFVIINRKPIDEYYD